MRLSGKRAVVTGGGRGIGAAVARALAAEGAAVVVSARSRGEVERVAAEVSGRAVPCDVTDPESVRRLAADAGPADILVNSAGVATSAPVKSLPLEEWNRTIAVNATGTFLSTQAFLPGMAERRWGRVVNVASVAALGGAPYIAAYAASKHAVLGFTRCAAAEVEGRGVTVNAVCPGYVDTEMTRANLERIRAKTGLAPEQALEAILRANRQERLLTAEEVARAVLDLCGEDAGAINGQAVTLDGRSPTAMTHEIVNPESLGAPRGYSHGVLAARGGRALFVAGQTAPGGDFAAQFERALRNVIEVVRKAGGKPEDVARLTIYVTDREQYAAARPEIGEAYRKVMGKHYPAMAMIEVKGLFDPGSLVELEATAVLP
jgi:NAD(P)-dependent dehydrogenase (short-subunit alcohol dehydrogenase family)